jgi:hypothetical protein
LPENPNPDSDGATTWNASAESGGSTNGPITFANSATDPGQPWVIISGSAP